MTYIKLIAKPDTWFKAGTEVLWETLEKDLAGWWVSRRPTLAEWENLKTQPYAAAVFRGTRIAEGSGELHNVGTEYEDGEWCPIDEFEAIETEEAV